MEGEGRGANRKGNKEDTGRKLELTLPEDVLKNEVCMSHILVPSHVIDGETEAERNSDNYHIFCERVRAGCEPGSDLLCHHGVPLTHRGVPISGVPPFSQLAWQLQEPRTQRPL